MFVLNRQNSIANLYLAEIRNKDIQGDRLRFKKNIKRLGFLLGYEVSKTLEYHRESITTPLATTEAHLPESNIVIITIMRAGLPFQEGFLDAFDHADAGFIGAWRKESDDIEVSLDYVATCDLKEKNVVIVDPMLATGKSLVKAIHELSKYGKPKSLHICNVISSPEGVSYLDQNLDLPYHLWTCALDERLNEKSYIVPGLGDAGDLSYGTKI